MVCSKSRLGMQSAEKNVTTDRISAEEPFEYLNINEKVLWQIIGPPNEIMQRHNIGQRVSYYRVSWRNSNPGLLFLGQSWRPWAGKYKPNLTLCTYMSVFFRQNEKGFDVHIQNEEFQLANQINAEQNDKPKLCEPKQGFRWKSRRTSCPAYVR
jgi:hypothetical protein